MAQSARTPEEARIEYRRLYRETHREELAEKQRRYAAEHREERAQYYAENRERFLAYDRERQGWRKWGERNPETVAAAASAWQKRRARLTRVAVFAYYGDSCACCGSRQRLEIDHANGGGKAHRAEIGMRGAGDRFYRWLIRNGLPDGFQTLCRRCNRSKGEGTTCHLAH